MGIKISEMSPDSSIGGSELIPVSDSGAAKSITPSGIKDFTIAGIQSIAAGTAVTGSDGIFILQGGALKPVDIGLVVQHAIDTVWGRADATPVAADKLAMKTSGGTEKTITITALAELIRSTIQAAILDISDLAELSSLTSADVFLVTSGAVGKKVQFSTISDALYESLATYVAALTATETPGDADIFYVLQGGTVEKKVTLSSLKTVLGNCLAPASTTENNIPQWDSAQKTLKDGLAVQTEVRASGTADDSSVPTEKAVRDLGGTLVDGSPEINDGLADDDTVLMYDESSGAQAKGLLSRFFTFICDHLAALVSKSIPADDDAFVLLDSADSMAPKAITLAEMKVAIGSTPKLDDCGEPDDNTDLDSSASRHGLLPKLSGSSADFLAGDGTWVPAEAASTPKLDDCNAPDDNTDLDATTLAHGLLPKLSGNTDEYLRGDGSWATPAGGGSYPDLGTVWVPSSQMVAAVTDGATAEAVEIGAVGSGQQSTVRAMSFPGATKDTYADFDVVFPEDWDLGTIKIKLYWSPKSGASNGDYVRFQVWAISAADGTFPSNAPTWTNIDDQCLTNTDLQLHITPASSEITIENTPTLNRLVHFRLGRDYDYSGGGSAMAEDAKLVGALIQYGRSGTPVAW